MRCVPDSRMSDGAAARTELLPAALYQGSANAWECDEMGHLNVRFHVERAVTGLGAMAAALAMPDAFKPAAGATLLPLDMHIRFLKEARPGAPMLMRGGVLETSETEAVLYAELRHLDGAPSSTFRMRVAHAEPRSQRAFPWSAASRAAFATLTCQLPAHGAPRSIDLTHAPAPFDLARALAIGVPRTGLSMIRADECDAFGALRPEMFIGRTSDAVPWLLADWRKQGAAAAAAGDGVTREAGGAAVEFRVSFLRWPRAGDHIEIRSGIVEVMEKANRIVHWLLDPARGGPWVRVEAIAISFDLKTRKAYAASPEMRAELAKHTLPDMMR